MAFLPKRWASWAATALLALAFNDFASNFIVSRDSNGALLVYDITDEDSFQKVKNWVKELRKMLGQEITLCIVGNKIDREKDRNVSLAEAEE